jgi:hypothetical protein
MGQQKGSEAALARNQSSAASDLLQVKTIDHAISGTIS